MYHRLRNIIRRIIDKWIVSVGIRLQEKANIIAEASLPKFANMPKNLRIDVPRRISNADRISIGDHVRIGPGSLLVPVIEYPSPLMKHPEKALPIQRFEPKIVIGNRVTSTGGLQIGTVSEVVIEDDVMFATNVNITDGLHGYANTDLPYKYQPMFRISPVRIGKGSWIGQNVVILPGVEIGEFCIIGANSVVTRSIPAKSIALGAPAQTIKTWDAATEQWVSAHENSS